MENNIVLFCTDDYLSEDDYDQFYLDWGYFKNQVIEQCEDHNCVLQGYEGLWNGQFKAGFCGNVEDAIDTMIDNKDDFKFENRNGELWITTYHHDGNNEYHIKCLTTLGDDLWDDYQSDNDETTAGWSKEKMHDYLMQHYSTEIVI